MKTHDEQRIFGRRKSPMIKKIFKETKNKFRGEYLAEYNWKQGFTMVFEREENVITDETY